MMQSSDTNIAPRRNSSIAPRRNSSIRGLIRRRGSHRSVPEEDSGQEPPAQEMHEIRRMDHSGHAPTPRASGRGRKSSSKRRGSLESSDSWASAASVVSMSEGDLDTLGWARRRGSLFSKRRLSSKIGIPSKDDSMRLADLTLSESGEQKQRSSSSADTLALSERSLLGANDDYGAADQLECGQQRPPRPPSPTERATSRFMHPRPVQARVDELFAHERNCFDAIKMQWHAHEAQLKEKQSASYSGRRKGKNRTGVWSNSLAGSDGRIAHLTDEQYLHFARTANYDEGAALTLLRESKRRMLGLTCAEMELQLRSKTIFIIPGLQSREGFDVFYMRPSRYFPRQTKTSTVIDSLAYIMKAMLECEESSTDGIILMANMAGWEMSNFSMNYCLQFMKCLQAEHFPVEVRKFLIIDPPSWFDKIWSIMKKMLTPSFQKRVHIIPNSQLGVYLGDRYRTYLPDDMAGGLNSTEEMIMDFIEYRKHVEYIREYGEKEEEVEARREG